jgi:hypothetical protein
MGQISALVTFGAIREKPPREPKTRSVVSNDLITGGVGGRVLQLKKLHDRQAVERVRDLVAMLPQI